MTSGTLADLTVELRRGKHVLARTAVPRVGTATREVVLRARHRHIAPDHYTLFVRHRENALIKRTVRMGKAHLLEP